MKYISILLSFLVTVTISCTSSGEAEESSSSDSTAVDTAIIDTIKAPDAYEVDSRSEVIDTLKKKSANSLWTSKCVAYRTWRPS